MNEQQALAKMVAPGTPRPGKYRSGVIQIHVTRACDKTCYGCTQGSQLRGKVTFISVEHFEQAVRSLDGYFGVVGVFGGNPALHPKFEQLCAILRATVPHNQRGIWCNNPMSTERARVMRDTFDPAVSNLNVHLDRHAYDLFKSGWPECYPVGLTQDSRHSPPYVGLKDVLWKPCLRCELEQEAGLEADGGSACPDCHGTGKVYDEEAGWDLISDCDINKHWSAMIGEFRGELRAWFCEVAGAQAILHQDNPEYPDTGVQLDRGWTDPEYQYRTWWRQPMEFFHRQVRKHCHECGVPLRGYGELAQAQDGTEQVSLAHQDIFKPRGDRRVELVQAREELEPGRLTKITDYLGNAQR